MKRIAILGGGMASLATAFELTSVPELAARCQITIYQQGHRLGGKAASSRTLTRDGVSRIEEHGLHMFFGFYENAFDLMRRTYEELTRLPREPGESWRLSLDEAFLPHDLIMLGSEYQGRLRSWALPFPRRDGKPGIPGDTRADRNPTTVDGGTILSGLLELMVAQLLNVADIEVEGLGPAFTGSDSLVGQLEGIRRRGRDGEDVVSELLFALISVRGLLQGEIAPRALVVALRALQSTFGALGRHPALRHARIRKLLAGTLAILREQTLRAFSYERDAFRRHQLRVSSDLFYTVAIGLLREDLLHENADWFSLDDLDYRAWMKRHGAQEETTRSAPLLTLADATFSDPKSAGAGAGTTLHLTLRMLLTYKQAVVFRLGAGMGETVVAPLYRVLRARGVRFRFFHRLEALVPGEREGQPVVESIAFRRQAHVLAGDDGYRPLMAFDDGMMCFPSVPDYRQLAEGQLLEQCGVDLEDSWNVWDPQRPLEHLQLGKDFDAVVLGVGLGGLPTLCAQLAKVQDAGPAPHRGPMRTAPRLSAMLRNVRTVETMAAQLWFRPSFPELLAPAANGVGVEYAQPYDTWSEMNHLLAHEQWPSHVKPGTLVYLCSAVDEPEGYQPPPFSDHEHTQRRKLEIKVLTQRWLDLHGGRIFSGSSLFGQFDYESLVDPHNRQGRARFEAQFWCATSNPSDRYVLSAPGTNRYRLRPHETGFRNLVLAGDWTLSAISAGCVEGAVMSGRDAARALVGVPRDIVGDWLTRVHSELLCSPILPSLPSYAAPVDNQPADPQAPQPAAPAVRDDLTSPGVIASSPSYLLPRYHKHPLDIQTAPPAECRGARVDWFFFPASLARLRALTAALNHPDSPTVYEPLLPLVAFVAAQVERISGGAERFGYIPERDYAFWLPVRASPRHGREQEHRASTIAWYQPCLWVDSCPAVVGGREAFGMNKVLAMLHAPNDHSSAFSVDTIAIKRQHPDALASMQRVLELRVASEQPGDVLFTIVDALSHAFEQVSTLGSQLNLASGRLEELLARLQPGELPIVCLKQFRDVERPELACYKALVEARSRALGKVSLSPWPGHHQLRIYPFESHPIAGLLGLPVSVRHESAGPVELVDALFALRTRLDFVLEPGRVLFDFVQAERARPSLAGPKGK